MQYGVVMFNDSVETLLLRHYGHDGPIPVALEQRLVNAVQQDAMLQPQAEGTVGRVLKHRISRRRAMMLVAVGSGGLSLVAASLEMLNTTVFGENTAQSALS
jgi:hypothetical protein